MIIEVIKEEPMIIQWIGIITATFAGIALMFNYFAFRKELMEFQMSILQNTQKHGMGNPTKKDPSRAVIG